IGSGSSGSSTGSGSGSGSSTGSGSGSGSDSGSSYPVEQANGSNTLKISSALAFACLTLLFI
ncbi:hypothetical protein D0Z00_004463, partial [Geotrichum galactomycetum]